MNIKYIIVFFFSLPSIFMAQNFDIQDSIKTSIPDQYTFLQADTFNSLYFVSKNDNMLIKYDKESSQIYQLSNFLPSKKLFIVNPFLIIVLDKVRKVLNFYDNKLIQTQDPIQIPLDKIYNPNTISVQDNQILWYFDDMLSGSVVQYDYRNDKNLTYSNSYSSYIQNNYKIVNNYLSNKKNNFLILKKDTEDKDEQETEIIKLTEKGIPLTFILDNYQQYFFDDNNFCWINNDVITFYDFENDPKVLVLPQKGEKYYVFNRQLYVWKNKIAYIYKIL